MSEAVSGIGARFERWDGSDWVQISEVNSITGPSKSRATIDVTSLDSTDGYAEYIAGLRQAGTISMTMNFVRANYDILDADFEDDDLQNYRVVLPDPDLTTLEFQGLVTELPISVQVGDRITSDVTLQISGPVSVYDGSSV